MHFQAFPRAQIFLSEAINEISIVRNSATTAGKEARQNSQLSVLQNLLCWLTSTNERPAAQPECFFQIIIKQAKSKQKRLIWRFFDR